MTYPKLIITGCPIWSIIGIPLGYITGYPVLTSLYITPIWSKTGCIQSIIPLY